MIYNRMGQGIMVDGVFYAAGMRVYANDTSDYAGLYGVITEIRTGDDRETENETPDIYCQFNVPVLSMEIEQLEARFSELYGKPMTLADIALDIVIMAPEMLEFHIDPYAIRPSTVVWAVIEDWATDDGAGHDEALYEEEKDARAVFHCKLSNEAEEGCISIWKDNDALQLDHGDCFYECWLDGEYPCNHYKISIKQKHVLHGFVPQEVQG